MNSQPLLGAGRGRGPLARIALLIVSAAAFAVAAVLGAVVFLALLGVLAVAALALALRVAWLRRSYRRRASVAATSASGRFDRSPTRGRATVEGEYREVTPPRGQPRD